MIRVLFRVVVVLVMLQLPLFFATNSRAESQQNQTQVAKSEEETQIEQLKQEIEAIQNQNQKQIEELQKKLDELQAKKSKEEKEGGLSNFAAGYKDGLFLKTRDDKFSLKFNAVIQGQFFIQNFDDNRKMSQDENITFQIRRLRLIFSGNAFYPWVKYFVQIGQDKGGTFETKDAFLDFARYEELTPRIGQWKVPFQIEEITSDALLEFGGDRSIVNDEFTLERDIGFELYGSLINNLFEYAGGVFNGAGRNVSPNPNGTNLLYVGRVMFEPFGKWEFSQGDRREDPSTPLFEIGAAVADLPHFNPTTEGGSNRANLAKAVLAIDKNITTADVFQFTADLGFKYYGFAFEGEYDLRRISGIVSTTTDNPKTAQGLRLQAGYLLLPPHVEAAFRYAIVSQYCQNIKGVCEREQEFTPALNYYLFKHRLKVTADYSLIVEKNPAGGNFKDSKFILQTQLFF